MPKGNTEDVDSSTDDVDETKNQGTDEDTDSADETGDDTADNEVDDGNDEDSEDPAVLKEKLQKQTDVANKNYARMKEAQGFKFDKATKKWIKKEQTERKIEVKKETGDISSTDLYALMQANVPQEDIETVKKYAALESLSIVDALKASTLKTILSTKAEERKTEQAANTGPVRRSNPKPTTDALLQKANATGELPDSQEDLEKLAEAHLMSK